MTRILRKMSLVGLALLASLGVNAQSYNKQAATISWAVGNESDGKLSDGISDAVSLTKVTVGSDLKINSTEKTYSLTVDGVKSTWGPYCNYTPQTGNPGCVATDMIEYTVQVKKGLTFTPTSISFDCVKDGTDGAYFTWKYTVDGTEYDGVAYSDPKTQIRRNNDTANPTVSPTHNETISDATGGQKVTIRFYMSNVANNKAMSIGNIKINGTIDGTVAVRAFKDFKIDFRTNPYTVLAPETGLPEGVSVTGSWHDAQHGYSGGTIVMPVDGPVKFTMGTCGYGSHDVIVKNANGETVGTFSNSGSCDTDKSFDHFVTWTYNSETATTLTLTMPSYYPFFYAEACDLIPMRTVTYYDVDGTTIIGSEEVEGGSALKYKYGASDVTVAEGQAFRGWFNSTQTTALKVKEGTSVQENLLLYARATKIENPQVGDIYTYPLNSASFYIEDHEAVESTGTYHDAQHGYSFGSNGTISVKTAGNAVMVLGLCKYGSASTIVVTDANGNQVGDVITLPVETDGATASVTYTGAPTTLTATFTAGGYLHNLTVYNVADIPEKNAAGYYALKSGDAASLQLVIAALKKGDKIYLPNGTYDFGEKCLTTIGVDSVSIVGESREKTIIRNTPTTEGIGVTATLYLTGKNLYLQDLSLQCSSEKCATPSASRCVTIQDKGNNNICKNVGLLSGQDTYYSNGAATQNAYFEDCYITGTVDYICGGGNVTFNHTTFYNLDRSSGDVVCAPATDASAKWGYVMLDCTIDGAASQVGKYNFCRPWQNSPACTWINTTMKIISSDAAYTNMSADKVLRFHEYNTKDAEGNVVTTHKLDACSGSASSDALYLTESQALSYTLSNIYGTWAPDNEAKQVTEKPTEGTHVYLLADGTMTTVAPTSGKARVANVRGGFGPEIDFTATAINNVDANVNAYGGAYYNLAGQRVSASAKGILVQNGKKIIK